jgi:hypothetical protein
MILLKSRSNRLLDSCSFYGKFKLDSAIFEPHAIGGTNLQVQTEWQLTVSESGSTRRRTVKIDQWVVDGQNFVYNSEDGMRRELAMDAASKQSLNLGLRVRPRHMFKKMAEDVASMYDSVKTAGVKKTIIYEIEQDHSIRNMLLIAIAIVLVGFGLHIRYSKKKNQVVSFETLTDDFQPIYKRDY